MNTKLISLGSLLLVCCGEAAAPPPAMMMIIEEPMNPEQKKYEPAKVTEARVQFPRLIDVETKIISRTCSPNPGVCHQTSNYPNMYTAGNFLSMIGARCNLEIPDPLQGWDGCEHRGDRLRLGELTREIAWVQKNQAGDWLMRMREPAAADEIFPLEILDAEELSLFAPPEEYELTVELVAGSEDARVRTTVPEPFFVEFLDSIIAGTSGGDLNRNGAFGADDPVLGASSLIEPGSLDRSYFWGRITGSVPGTRMPLANQALSDAEYVAIACLIEGIDPDGEPSALDPINYDNCEYARR